MEWCCGCQKNVIPKSIVHYESTGSIKTRKRVVIRSCPKCHLIINTAYESDFTLEHLGIPFDSLDELQHYWEEQESRCH